MLEEANLIPVGDEHTGSVVGLMAKGGFILPSGNTLGPNAFQDVILAQWNLFWEKQLISPRPRVLVRMGDAIEGVHHGSSQIWGTPFDQLGHIEGMYSPLMAAFTYRLSVNGTIVHVGDEGCADEALAKRLGFDEIGGRKSNYHIRPTIAGALCDIAHEGPRAGQMPHTEGNTLRSFARAMVYKDLAAGRRPPRIILRAHGHRKCHETVRVEDYVVDAYLTPSWQGRTSFGHKVSSLQVLADIGGTCIHIKNGQVIDDGDPFDIVQFKDTPEIEL